MSTEEYKVTVARNSRNYKDLKSTLDWYNCVIVSSHSSTSSRLKRVDKSPIVSSVLVDDLSKPIRTRNSRKVYYYLNFAGIYKFAIIRAHTTSAFFLFLLQESLLQESRKITHFDENTRRRVHIARVTVIIIDLWINGMFFVQRVW